MTKTTPAAPRAKKVPTQRSVHGDIVTDNYEWLRKKDNSEVLEHLRAENAYTDALTAEQQPLRDAIFQEIKNRTQETDLSVPWRKDDWWYFTRSVEGKQYGIHARVPALNTGDFLGDWTPPVIDPNGALEGEEILLDENVEAADQPFFSLGAFTVSSDANLLAFAVDTAGDERFTLYIKDLRTGELLPDVIPGVFYGAVFDPDATRIFYTVVDEAWRPYQVKSHVLGTSVEEDTLVYEEEDVSMWTGMDLSADESMLLISAANSEVSEVHVLDLTEPQATLTLLLPREDGILYEAEPISVNGLDAFLLTHNFNAPNSMVSLVLATEFAKPLEDQVWNVVVPHRRDVRVNGIALTESHMVTSLRKDTLNTVEFLPVEGIGTAEQHPSHEPEFAEELRTIQIARSDFSAPVVRLSYTSFFTPAQVLDYYLHSGELVLRKEQEVLGGYNPRDYVAERVWARAEDGTKVPLSVLRSTKIKHDGANPGLIYGYGSYEMSMDPAFSLSRLSLLDRGIVFVIAHVRGGGELGRAWYEDGKKLNKRNTFTDFIAATDWLADSGWVDPAKIVAMGGSAGGLLMGAVANLAPQKYAGIVAQVPFVDALTTILDPNLPLSALEWEEWGNPIEDREVYEYMRSYSPYENVQPVDYPAIAAITSLNDTRVFYVEPAKWVAKLREVGTGSAPLVLKTEMDGGHGGASGRYEKWKDVAWDYAFAATVLGATELVN